MVSGEFLCIYLASAKLVKHNGFMTYEVINLRTRKSHGKFETLDEARGCVAYDQLTAWEIWKLDMVVVAYRDPGDVPLYLLPKWNGKPAKRAKRGSR